MRYTTDILLFLSMEITSLHGAAIYRMPCHIAVHDQSILNADNAVCHLGNVVVMGDQDDRLLKLSGNHFQQPQDIMA